MSCCLCLQVVVEIWTIAAWKLWKSTWIYFSNQWEVCGICRRRQRWSTGCHLTIWNCAMLSQGSCLAVYTLHSSTLNLGNTSSILQLHYYSIYLLQFYFISFARHSCNIILSVVNFVLPVMYEMVGFFHLTYSQDTHVDFDAEYFKNCCFMQRCFEVVYAVSNVVSTTATSFKCLGLFNY